MKIERNFRTGGCSTNLVINNKHYYADASPVEMAGKHVIETMIFKADEQFNVTDWADPVFTDIDPYSGGQVEEELLKLKIENFKNSLKPEVSEKQKEIINRLLNLSKAQVEICEKALSDNATEQDIVLACYFAHLQNIK
jgi:hypothetical protein